jgi:Transposase DDE domain
MKLGLSAPDLSMLSRWRRLTVTLPVKNLSKSLHLVIESTGVKVYSEGEWKVCQHGVGKRRTCRKHYLCLDEATLEIISAMASTNDLSNAEAPAGLASGHAQIDRTSRRRRRLRSARTLRHAQWPLGEGYDPASQGGQDMEPRQ